MPTASPTESAALDRSPAPYGGIGFHGPLCPDGRAARAAECRDPCPERSRPFVLAVTIIASGMAFIDGTIVTIALPALQADFAAGFGSLQWVVNAYALLLGGLILIGGGAGDRFGRRRILLMGIAIFAAASLVCALAPTIGVLIGARAVKGIGAALLVPQSLAIIAAAFPKETRGRAIGIWAGASAITLAMGPPLGGILIDTLGWRSVFWINLPLSAFAIGLALAHVPESRDETARGPLDWLGGSVSIVAFGLLAVGLTRFAEASEAIAIPAVLLILGVTGLVFFLVIESRAASPLMPLSLFSSRVFSGANLLTLFLYGALSAVLFLLPFDLIERRGLSATQVGLTLLPFGAIVGTLSRAAGDWADRKGPRQPLVLGSMLLAGAAASMALGIESYWLGVLAPVLLMSVAMAMVAAPLTTAVMNAAPDTQSGAASGINNAVSRLAGLFAVAIVATIASVVFAGAIEAAGSLTAASRFGVLPAMEDPARTLFESAFGRAYAFAQGMAAVWSLLAALVAWLSIPPRQSD
jgi:EmrB/QacA subfamily drug resistance transporter